MLLRRSVAVQHPIIYKLLLWLANYGPSPLLRTQSVRLLNFLPTDRSLVAQFAAALSSTDTAAQLKPLLLKGSEHGDSTPAPAGLLYRVQVCAKPRIEDHTVTNAQCWALGQGLT